MKTVVATFAAATLLLSGAAFAKEKDCGKQCSEMVKICEKGCDQMNKKGGKGDPRNCTRGCQQITKQCEQTCEKKKAKR